MSTEKIREEFLTWWWHEDRIELRQSCAEGWGIYIWSASRESLVIDLPESVSIHNTEVIKAVGRHIIAQGLKVKP